METGPTWLYVAVGTLGLRRSDMTREFTYRPPGTIPLAPGVAADLRNAGAEELVLLVVTVTPIGASDVGALVVADRSGPSAAPPDDRMTTAMDDRRFDAWAKALVTARPQRAAPRFLVGGALGALADRRAG